MNNNDPGGKSRNADELEKTRYMGVVSEEIVLRVLEGSIGKYFRSEQFMDYESHVDIIMSNGEIERTIEIRSSLPRNGIMWCLFDSNGFDMIGAYATSNKRLENWKDLYIRVLFKTTCNMNEKGPAFSYTVPHYVMIVGSAKRKMFEEKGYIGNLKQENADYHLMKPISLALDFEGTLKSIRDMLGLSLEE